VYLLRKEIKKICSGKQNGGNGNTNKRLSTLRKLYHLLDHEPHLAASQFNMSRQTTSIPWPMHKLLTNTQLLIESLARGKNEWRVSTETAPHKDKYRRKPPFKPKELRASNLKVQFYFSKLISCLSHNGKFTIVGTTNHLMVRGGISSYTGCENSK